MLNCHEVTRLLSEAQERPLSLADRARLKLHTMMCAGCRNFEHQMQTLREAMRRFAGKGGDRNGRD